MSDISELRGAERFVISEPLSGAYGSGNVNIINLSTIGAQIEHPQPLRVGTRARLSFTRDDVSAAVQGITMWSHLSTTADAAGKYVYVSGVRVESGNQELAIALNQLFKRGVIRRDRESLERKRKRMLERLSEKSRPMIKHLPTTIDVPPSQLLLVQHARERLLANPEEALKWYNRARYVITTGTEVTIPEAVRGREDVLAVWEYLDRSVDLHVIAAAFDRLRVRREDEQSPEQPETRG